MQVHLMRSAEPGCEPRCLEWIAAQGRIEGGTAARFRRVLRQIGRRKVPVLIDSAGGRVDEAFEVGRLLRARGLDVAVGRTELIGCAAADKECRRRARTRKAQPGLPIGDLAKCASSCAFILAAGTRRLVGPTAFVGVHRIRSYYVYTRVLRTYRVTATSRRLLSERRVTEKVVEIHTPPKTYDQIRRYFRDMGVGEGIMPLILATPGDRLHWLTRDELQATGLATDWIDGAEVLTGAASPAAPMAVPMAAPLAAHAPDGALGKAASALSTAGPIQAPNTSPDPGANEGVASPPSPTSAPLRPALPP
jgi:hypothetical protein